MKNLYKVTCYTPYCETETIYWVLANHEGDIPEEDLNNWIYESAEDFEIEEARENYGYDISGPYELYEAVREGYCGLADAEY